MVRPSDSRRGLLRMPWRSRSSRQRAHRAQLQIARKDRADRLGLGRDHHDLLVDRRIAERDRTPDPNALALGGRDLVAHPLPDQLPLELGK